MAISAYPRTAVQNSKSNTNKPNGLSLMIVDPVTGEYTPATAATFAGGGGGGDASAANQNTQISEAQTANQYLVNIQDINAIISNSLINTNSNKSISQLLFSDDLTKSLAQLLVNNDNLSAADLLSSINDLLTSINSTLQNIDGNITNGNQRVVIQGTDGQTAIVDGEQALLVNQV